MLTAVPWTAEAPEAEPSPSPGAELAMADAVVPPKATAAVPADKEKEMQMQEAAKFLQDVPQASDPQGHQQARRAFGAEASLGLQSLPWA